MKYPSKLEKISELGDKSIINSAIDFSYNYKPKLIQMALIPTRPSTAFSSITFDMEYKETSSKATLNMVIDKLSIFILCLC